jgi:hypothetical protein
MLPVQATLAPVRWPRILRRIAETHLTVGTVTADKFRGAYQYDVSLVTSAMPKVRLGTLVKDKLEFC